MQIKWTHRTPDGRGLAVVVTDDAVTVTEPDGDVYKLTYQDGALTGSRLAQSHRTAIAAHIAANLAASAMGL
jgi:YD repeat-containing protein